jgi:GTP-binding protein
MTLPRVAIVGRPNVGKSSLLNRLVGRRVSIVEPTAGVTRDRVVVPVEYDGCQFELVDTGGLGLVDEEQLKAHIESQIEVALATCDRILFLVDGKDGRVPADDLVARRLRRLGKPVDLIVNKIESHAEEMTIGTWIGLGFGEPRAISAKEGYGCTDLLQYLVDVLPEHAVSELPTDRLAIAIVGKRNSGKSTIVNRLCGEERVIVSDIPGTTRDAVDVEFDWNGRKLLAIDTAGVRKKKSIENAIELFSHSRSTASIRRASVVVHMFDVREPISQVDKNLAAYCVEHHKPVVLVGNKIDLADEVDIEKWDKYIKQQLAGLDHAPVVFLSAKDGQNVDDMIELLFDLHRQASTRFATPKLNEVLQRAKEKLMPRGRGLFPKLFYGTQLGVDPVSILVFVNEPRLFRGQYSRYLEQVLRTEFDCAEVPLRMVFRKREKVILADRG